MNKLTQSLMAGLMAGSLAACGGGGGGGDPAPTTYTVSGTLSGLPAGESVVLVNNGGSAQTLTADGNFQFTGLANGASYKIRVTTQPSGRTCVVTNGQGVISGADVSGVQVSCQFPFALDNTFGEDANGNGTPDGLYTLDGYGTADDDVIHDVVRDAQGRIYAVGSLGWTLSLPGGSSLRLADAVVWRFLEDGSLDPGFGTGGRLVLAKGTLGAAFARAAAFDGSGRLVIAGQRDGDMAVWRLDANGALDTTFATNGEFLENAATSSTTQDAAYDVAVSDSGTIYVVGEQQNSNRDLAIWALNASGGLETTFYGSGYRIVDDAVATGSSTDEWGRAIVLTGSGAGFRITVAGNVSDGTEQDMFVMQFYANGNLNTQNFGDASLPSGTTGIRHKPLSGGDEEVQDMIFDSANNRFLVAGRIDMQTSGTQDFDAMVWALTQYGSDDGTFGNSSGVLKGVSYIGNSIGNDDARAISLDSTGQYILLAGVNDYGSGGFLINGPNAVIWRLASSNGAVDTAWGQGGGAAVLVIPTGHDPASPVNSVANGLVVDDQDRVIAGGQFDSASEGVNAALWQLVP